MFGIPVPTPVEGPVTDSELRAAPVPVSGPLTDTELRATPVDVAGTVATGGLTDAELRASPVPVNVGNFPATAKTVSTQVVGGDIGIVVNSVIHGLTTGGGGGYVDVKVTPSGALAVDATVNGSVTANAGTNLNTSALSLETTQTTVASEIGATNESAAATDTSTSGLNGLIKRLLTRFTTFLALLPASLGQKTSANSLAVVVASDQPALAVSGTITASGTVNNIPNRPSQGAGRTSVLFNASAQTGDATLYSVTGGKTFYLTTLVLSAFNTSSTGAGNLQLKDGGAGGTLKAPFIMPTAGVGALLAAQPLLPGSITFQEPIPFTTNVFMDVVGGTITYSVTGVGYEE